MVDPPSARDLAFSLFDQSRPVAVRGDPSVGVVATAVRRGQAHVRLLVVDPARRRQGLGSDLLADAEADLSGRGPIVVGADAPDYMFPGADTTEIGLLTLLERRGYRRVDTTFNMSVDLASLPSPPDVAEVHAKIDGGELRAFTTAHYPGWTDEALWAHAAGTIVATLDADGLSGFCAWDVTRQGWLGPMAVRPAERRRGTGTPLVLAALHRMADSGRASAQISWVGPLAFYAKTVGAIISRTFFVYRQDR